MNREQWYKKMYNTIHKAKDDGNLLDSPVCDTAPDLSVVNS